MVLSSLVSSLIPVAIYLLQSDPERTSGLWKNIRIFIVRMLTLLIVASLIHAVVKLLAGQDADNHIYRLDRLK